MALEVFARTEDWKLFNSSLLIEVTRPSGVFTCTGVAVAPKILVTAGHCLEGEIEKVRVFAQAKYDPEQTSLEIKKFKLHPDYNSRSSRYLADIAKIIMQEEIPSSINIHPIYRGELIKGNILRFGFGARNNRNVRTVVTPVLRRLNHEKNVLELDDMYSRSGDSGGPIFMQESQKVFLLAIHSTFSHGPEGEYSLNPRLAEYYSWIFEH